MDPETAKFIAELARAVRVHDWPAAIHRWDWLLAHHGYLRDAHPHMSALLREEEAMVYEHSNSVH